MFLNPTFNRTFNLCKLVAIHWEDFQFLEYLTFSEAWLNYYDQNVDAVNCKKFLLDKLEVTTPAHPLIPEFRADLEIAGPQGLPIKL
ncbi:MAG: hypothetical protein ACTSRK_15655 [Promethearchaeota archaeon]